MKNLLISFSGGETSAFMTKLIFTHPKYKDVNKVVVFANTGKEREETLQFVHDFATNEGIDVVWLEAVIYPEKGKGVGYRIVDFETADREGKVFESVIAKYGLPSALARHCSSMMKSKPIKKFGVDFFGDKNYDTAIGIRADEENRLGSFHYPLFELGVTKPMIQAYWDKQSYKLNLKSYEGNCDFCFLKTPRKRMTIASDNPNLTKWWSDMEAKYGKGEYGMYDARNRLTVQDIVEMAELNFRRELCDREKKMLSLFDMQPQIDCFCKNT